MGVPLAGGGMSPPILSCLYENIKGSKPGPSVRRGGMSSPTISVVLFDYIKGSKPGPSVRRGWIVILSMAKDLYTKDASLRSA